MFRLYLTNLSAEWIVLAAKLPVTLSHTEGFLTPDSFHSASLVTWGSSCASKEAKFIKEFNFLGFSRCFSARIEQSSKKFKIQSNGVILGWFFEFCSILSKKQQLIPKKIKILDEFHFFRHPTWPPVTILVEIYLVLYFVLKFNNRGATYNYLLDLQSNVEDICSWIDDNK